MTYLGDLKKTQIIDQLFQVDLGDRDAVWKKQFLDNVAEASFRCRDPQLITGPDGFPYFALDLPEPYKEFQCFVVKHMIDDFILAKGCGIVFEAEPASAQWVFSYGDLLNFHLSGQFYSEENASSTDEEEPKGTVLLGQPSENFLPKAARAVLRSYLAAYQATNPRVLLMTRQNQPTPSQELIFELDETQFATPELHDQARQRISWFLPRHYRYSTIGLNSSFSSMMEPL